MTNSATTWKRSSAATRRSHAGIYGRIALDSSVAIRAERQKITVAQLFERIRSIHPGEMAALTAVGVTELVHGIYRADTRARAELRRSFLDELLLSLPVLNYTLDVAKLVGRLDGEQTARGNIIPSVDLFIGGTALYYDYSVMTANPRDFHRIPGLDVITFS